MPKPQPAPAAPAKEIVLPLGDILNRIPKEYLLPGPHDPKMPIRFPAQELAESMAKGKTTMSIARLAKACPEVIRADPNKSVDVPFPFQKAMGQLLHSDAADFSARELRHRPATIGGGTVAGPAALRGQQGKQTSQQAQGGGVPIIAPANGGDDEKIHLSLHAIVAALPKEWQTPGLQGLDETARVTLPLGLVEHQLPTGRVEVPLGHFLAGMPANLRSHFPSDPNRQVPIPLTEVFPNLPSDPSARSGVPGVREQVASLESSAVNRDSNKLSDELAKKLVEASAKINALVRERDQAIQQREEITSQLAALREEMKRHTEAMKGQANIGGMNAENEATKARLEGMAKERDVVISEKEKEIGLLREQLEAQRKDQQAVQAERDQAQKQRTELAEQMQALKAQHEKELESTSHQIHARVQEKDEGLSRLTQSIEDQKREVKNLQRERDHAIR